MQPGLGVYAAIVRIIQSQPPSLSYGWAELGIQSADHTICSGPYYLPSATEQPTDHTNAEHKV